MKPAMDKPGGSGRPASSLVPPARPRGRPAGIRAVLVSAALLLAAATGSGRQAQAVPQPAQLQAPPPAQLQAPPPSELQAPPAAPAPSRPSLAPPAQNPPPPPPTAAPQSPPPPPQNPPAPGESPAAPAAPTVPPLPPASPQEAADVQALLDRVNFSPGVVDGAFGENTRKALAGFQEAHDLPVTGQVDPLTWQNLLAASGGKPWTEYTITADDTKGPFYEIPADMEAKAKLPALGYESPLQLLAERFHASEKLLHARNPQAQFVAGETIQVPNVRQVPERRTASPPANARIVVSKSRLTLTVDNGDDLLFFAPVSAGSEHDPLPLGNWKVLGVSHRPVFHYNPQLFWDANPKNAKAAIAPGPNNPVGLVWIDLSKEHYGIHGTPDPEKIGTTYSHGCVRMTNWDALTVAGLVKPGTAVVFEP
jgi:lipoprotein-anchoring transpeptidase ErfK/SrfK